ncbi:hypothetical protein KKA85_03480 [bacterium]|nr:hypothetical protein [bacterium]MBU1674825.1 hypothetical protein [bacterium]
MKTITLLLMSALLLVGTTTALATDIPDGAIITERIWNDCPTSVITSVNNYATMVSIHEQKQFCGAGWGSRHNWRFAQGGVAQNFANGDGFRFCADLTISGTGSGEAGLNLSPWWSQAVDGVFMCNANTGEISCWGGRLPFYSFTVEHGLTYTLGVTVHMEITYLPNMLSSTNPGTVEYTLVMGGTPYSSGQLAFDEGNPAEDPPYGVWGILNDAQAGGYFLHTLQEGDPDGFVLVEWADICFEDLGTVANEDATWGQVKTLYR